jgi:hypothetical protein
VDDFELPGPITPHKVPGQSVFDAYANVGDQHRAYGLGPNDTLQNLAEIRDAFDRGTAAGRGNWFVRLFRH